VGCDLVSDGRKASKKGHPTLGPKTSGEESANPDRGRRQLPEETSKEKPAEVGKGPKAKAQSRRPKRGERGPRREKKERGRAKSYQADGKEQIIAIEEERKVGYCLSWSHSL